eukprot:3409662-Rhodomonas_salina.1
MAMEPCMRDMHPEDPSRSFCTVWRETDPEVCGPMCMVSSCDWYVLPPPRHDSHTRCPTLSDLSAARCTGARGVLAAPELVYVKAGGTARGRGRSRPGTLPDFMLAAGSALGRCNLSKHSRCRGWVPQGSGDALGPAAPTRTHHFRPGATARRLARPVPTRRGAPRSTTSQRWGVDCVLVVIAARLCHAPSPAVMTDLVFSPLLTRWGWQLVVRVREGEVSDEGDMTAGLSWGECSPDHPRLPGVDFDYDKNHLLGLLELSSAQLFR